MAQTTVKDVEGRVKVFRNAAHAWGARNPFSFGTITLVVGLIVGLWLG
jgi:hypothetical protein